MEGAKKAALSELGRLDAEHAAKIVIRSKDAGEEDVAAGLEEGAGARPIELFAVQLRHAAQPLDLGEM